MVSGVVHWLLVNPTGPWIITADTDELRRIVTELTRILKPRVSKGWSELCHGPRLKCWEIRFN